MSASRLRRQTRSQRADRRRLVPFAGVDGEGGDIDSKHEYLMLRAGDRLLETGKPLTSYECFEFLADLPKDKIYVAFAFDYDVTMMLRHLTPEKFNQVFQRDERAITDDSGRSTGRHFPVDVGHDSFQIDYMPHKEFKVRRKGQKWTVINDTFTFFQSSFVAALKKWFADQPEYIEAIEKIAEGKEMRHDFGEVTEYERDYNKLECIMLELLMEKFRDLSLSLDINPIKWQGPGNLVSAVFKREGIPRKQGRHVPLDVWMSANAAYYGGRFEASDYGLINEPVYQYDINSAYASTYRGLPCLICGDWIESTRLPDDSNIYLAKVQFHHRDDLKWNVLPVRSELGTLLFPRDGIGWYWCHELEVAKQWCDITVLECYVYQNNCGHRYFDWVYDLYDLRDEVGKTSGKGKVLKIVLATIYGKLAQSKGHPVFSNPIWSGLVVSSCRAKLITAALQRDRADDVVMLATDGMFCTSPRELPVSHALGDWELTRHDSLFIVQSGLYFMPGEKPKTRGILQSKVIEYESAFRDLWNAWCCSDHLDIPRISIPLRNFISARLAHARGKGWSAGRWVVAHKVVAFDWTTKRCNPIVTDNRLRTVPVPGSPELESVATKYTIGGPIDDIILMQQDQPDWADHLSWDDE